MDGTRGGPAITAALYAGRGVTDALRALRAHRWVPDRRPEVLHSVRATAAAAGRLILLPGWRLRLPEYPIVVEVLSARDHLLAMARLLSARLTEEGVFHQLFLFSADPERLRDENEIQFGIGDVAARYAADILIFMGDGDIFVDRITLTLRPWTEQLSAWRQVVLLTPVPRRRWSWRERRIAESGVTLLPATPEGLGLLGDFLRSGSRPPRLAFQRPPVRPGFLVREGRQAPLWHSDDWPSDAIREKVLDAIRQEVPDESFEALAVAALFPEVRPDLTLHLGEVLKDRAGHPLLDEERYGALAALPWMRYGRMPDWLRFDLAQTLQPTRENEARETLRAWVDTKPTNGLGASVEIVVGSTQKNKPLPDKPKGETLVRDAIFLHLQRGESVSTLDLRVPEELEQLVPSSRLSNILRVLGIGIFSLPIILMFAAATGMDFVSHVGHFAYTLSLYFVQPMLILSILMILCLNSVDAIVKLLSRVQIVLGFVFWVTFAFAAVSDIRTAPPSEYLYDLLVFLPGLAIPFFRYDNRIYASSKFEHIFSPVPEYFPGLLLIIFSVIVFELVAEPSGYNQPIDLYTILLFDIGFVFVYIVNTSLKLHVSLGLTAVSSSLPLGIVQIFHHIYPDVPPGTWITTLFVACCAAAPFGHLLIANKLGRETARFGLAYCAATIVIAFFLPDVRRQMI